MAQDWCFFIPIDAFVEGKGYIPSMVRRGQPGHRPLAGNDPFAEPYYWGMTYEKAKAVADAENTKMGLSKLEAMEIVASSMAASNQ